MIGAVGHDEFGYALHTNLEKNHIDISGISKVNIPSGIAVITVCGGDNQIILYSGANSQVNTEMIDKNIELIKWADMVIFQFEIPVPTVEYAIKLSKKLGKLVILNPAPLKDFNMDLLKYIDFLILNEIETQQLLNTKIETYNDAQDAIRKISAQGVTTAIITMGEKGCVYNDGNDIKIQKAFKVDVVDTTAAGDSFIGGIAKSILDGKNINDAILYASAASAIVVSRLGASTSIPTDSEVVNFISKSLHA
jgi:ribokinase